MAELDWLGKAEHWGEWVRFSETEIASPQSVWMMRSPSGKVRFYEVGKGQVGPECKHVVAAGLWAYGNGFIDPDAPIGFNLAARAESQLGLADARLRNDPQSGDSARKHRSVPSVGR